MFVIDTKSCAHVLTVVDVISPAHYFFFLLKKISEVLSFHSVWTVAEISRPMLVGQGQILCIGFQVVVRGIGRIRPADIHVVPFPVELNFIPCCVDFAGFSRLVV